MAQLFVFGQRSDPTLASATPAPGSFAKGDNGFAYFGSDQHHRHLAAAICRYLTDSRSFVLVTGDPQPSGELIADAINTSNNATYRANVVQCRPDMDLGKLVRAYNAELKLAQNASASKRIESRNGLEGRPIEAESGGIWTLISYLMAERQNGITRMLILKDADLLDPRCFDDLQRLAQLDEQRVMPVVLLSNATDGGALAPFEVSQSPIFGRLPIDHLEPQEVGAFIRSQLEALGNAPEMDVLFPPRIVEAITVASGGNATVVNRLANKVLAAFPNRNLPSTPADAQTTDDVHPLAGEGCPIAVGAPVEQEGAAIADAAPGTGAVRADAAETSITGLSSPIESARGAELIVESVTQDESGAADQSASRETIGLLESSLAESWKFEVSDRNAAFQPNREISRTRNDLPGTPGEFGAVKCTEETERSKELPDQGFQITGSAFQSTGGLASGPLPGMSPTAAAVAGMVAPEASPLDATEVDQQVPLEAESAAADAALGGQVLGRAESRFGAGWTITVVAIAVSIASLVLLYLNDLGFRHELAKALSRASALSSPQPGAQVALPPLMLPSAPQAVTAQPSSRVRVPAVSSTVHASPQGIASPRSTTAAIGSARRDDSTTSGPHAPRSQAPTAIAGAPIESSSNQSSAHVVDHARSAAMRSTPSDHLGSNADAIMVMRGEQLLSTGDVVSARRFFERVAPAGNAAAAYGLAETYDPLFLKEIGARGIPGQPAAAVVWYQRAVVAGSVKAVARLRQLQSAISGASVANHGVGK